MGVCAHGVIERLVHRRTPFTPQLVEQAVVSCCEDVIVERGVVDAEDVDSMTDQIRKRASHGRQPPDDPAEAEEAAPQNILTE
jgi:uncharacterized protein CbrC (UPF0167 family)